MVMFTWRCLTFTLTNMHLDGNIVRNGLKFSMLPNGLYSLGDVNIHADDRYILKMAVL